MQIRINVPDEIASLAARAGVGPEDYVERLIAKLVSAPDKQAALREELLADWDQYQVSRLHLTGEEVDAWLSSIEAGNAAELPELHR